MFHIWLEHPSLWEEVVAEVSTRNGADPAGPPPDQPRKILVRSAYVYRGVGVRVSIRIAVGVRDRVKERIGLRIRDMFRGWASIRLRLRVQVQGEG